MFGEDLRNFANLSILPNSLQPSEIPLICHQLLSHHANLFHLRPVGDNCFAKSSPMFFSYIFDNFMVKVACRCR